MKNKEKKVVRGNPKRLAMKAANLRRLEGVIGNTKNPLSPARYARMLGVHPTTARGYFEILEKQGVVKRVNYHPGDRRGRPAVFFQNAEAIKGKS